MINSTKYSAAFLAAVLVAGTIALSFPSFMVGAQADSYYEQDNNYKKLDKKDVSVKSIKCNNINVNVNGLEFDGLPPALSGLLPGGETEDDGQYGASSYGSGIYGDVGQSGYDKNNNSFKFICINNNNNTVVIQPPPVVNETSPCVECFAAFPTIQEEIEDFLVEQTEGFGIGFDGENIFIPGEVNTIEQLCPLLQGHTDVIVQALIQNLFERETGENPPLEQLFALTECLLEAGVTVEFEPTPEEGNGFNAQGGGTGTETLNPLGEIPTGPGVAAFNLP